jgi:CRISPR/Cas system-associated exonuclease Cas4 (RecB family)
MSIDYLANKYPHPRDSHITFEEGPHIYTIDGDSDFTSVTTWNHSHFEGFDADKIITNMMKRDNWPKSKYFGKTREEIKAGWDKNRDEAADAGTKMHYDIECYYNNCPKENTSIEYGYFNKFLEDFRNLKPYRTEWMIYHEDLKLAGSIDMVFEGEDGNLLIYDWKRCREIRKSGFDKYAKKECIEHLPDSNYWHYCLQLNTYKAILEEKYDKKVTELYLVCMHPDNANKSYQRIKVADLQKEVKDLFEERKKEMS